jgi:hypothetical protein
MAAVVYDEESKEIHCYVGAENVYQMMWYLLGSL